MPDPIAFRPEDFAPEIELLEEIPGRWSIIGGMAAIIWAERYLKSDERVAFGLGEPLTSKDLDLRGHRAHAMIIRGFWAAQGQGEMQEFRWKDTGRHSWALASHPRGDPRRRVVEVTEQLPGLQSREGLALRITHREIRLHVLDPVSCLIAKADVLRRELADNAVGKRKDAAHVALLLQAVPRYLEEIASRSSSVVDAARELARSAPATAEAVRQLAACRALEKLGTAGHP